MRRPDKSEAPTPFDPGADFMIIAFALILVLAALLIDVLCLPSIFLAVAAMQWMASLHPPDPLAPLYAFLVGAMAARLALEVLRRSVVRTKD